MSLEHLLVHLREPVLLATHGAPSTTESEPRARVFYETLSRLQGITAGGSDEEPLEEIARAVLAQGMASLGATSGGVFLVDESGENLELKGAIGYQEKYLDLYRLVSLDRVMPLTDAFNKKTRLFLGGSDDLATLYPEFAGTHKEIAEHALACVPMEHDGRAVGVIAMGFPLPWTFRDDDRVLLQALGLRCVQVLETTRLARSERTARRLAERSASQLARLHGFTGALAQAITWAQVVETVVEMGMAATSARSCEVWIPSDDGMTVSCAGSAGKNRSSEEDAQTPLERSIRKPIFDSMRAGSPVWIESCRQMEERYPDVLRTFAGDGEASLACLPLFAQGRCVGGLVFSYAGVHRFLEDERAFLQVLSWHAAQAIERSRLYAAERNAREAAEANHHRKDEFLAMLGHELRNPLAPILTAIDSDEPPRRQRVRGGADDHLAPGPARRPPGGRSPRRFAHHEREDPAPEGAHRGG